MAGVGADELSLHPINSWCLRKIWNYWQLPYLPVSHLSCLGKLKWYFLTFSLTVFPSFLVPRRVWSTFTGTTGISPPPFTQLPFQIWLALGYSFSSSRPDFPEPHVCVSYLFLLMTPAGVWPIFNHVISFRSRIPSIWGWRQGGWYERPAQYSPGWSESTEHSRIVGGLAVLLPTNRVKVCLVMGFVPHKARLLLWMRI